MVARRSPKGVEVWPLITLETWYNLPAAEAASTAVMGLEAFTFLATWCCGMTPTSQSCQFKAWFTSEPWRGNVTGADKGAIEERER